jgi:flagellar protein FliS
MYQDVVKSYQQANFFTADPLKLVIMCYEGAISSLKLARDSYAAKEYEAKGKALQKALDIIHELNASLDMQKGGEIAANLRSLYHYITQALIEGDLKRDLNIFEKAIRMLEELESAWKAIASANIGAGEARPKAAGISYGGAKPVTGARVWST